MNTFIVLCTIKHVVDNDDWWYTACICNKVVYPDSKMFFCEKCNKHIMKVTFRYTFCNVSYLFITQYWLQFNTDIVFYGRYKCNYVSLMRLILPLSFSLTEKQTQCWINHVLKFWKLMIRLSLHTFRCELYYIILYIYIKILVNLNFILILEWKSSKIICRHTGEKGFIQGWFKNWYRFQVWANL